MSAYGAAAGWLTRRRQGQLRRLAAAFLLGQEGLRPVLDVRDCHLPEGILLSTYEHYKAATGVSMQALYGDALADGMHILVDSCRLILYSEKRAAACPQRGRFTLAHELGHALCGHEEETQENEAEANYFAAAFVCPPCLLAPFVDHEAEEIIQRVRRQFGLSWGTAAAQVHGLVRQGLSLAALSPEEQAFARRYWNEICPRAAQVPEKSCAGHSHIRDDCEIIGF